MFFGFGKKKNDVNDMAGTVSDLKRKNALLSAQVSDLQAKLAKAEDKLRFSERNEASLTNNVNTLEQKNKNLEEELIKALQPVKGRKITKTEKAIESHFKAFEEQAKNAGASTQFYAAMTIEGKRGKPELVEINSVGEMNDFIKKARAGKVKVLVNG